MSTNKYVRARFIIRGWHFCENCIRNWSGGWQFWRTHCFVKIPMKFNKTVNEDTIKLFNRKYTIELMNNAVDRSFVVPIVWRILWNHDLGLLVTFCWYYSEPDEYQVSRRKSFEDIWWHCREFPWTLYVP